MDKEAAAKHLGVSVRSLQRLTAEGLFNPAFTGPKGAAVYSLEELEQWRGMSEDDRKRARGAARSRRQTAALSPVTGATGAADVTGNAVVTVTRDSDARREFAEMIARAVATTPAVNLADKLLLNLEEAARLSGLSRSHLREAIRAGKLNAKIIGRGWKMKRRDLDSYVSQL